MEKQEKIEPSPSPCLNCPDPKGILQISEYMKIGVGFGSAMLLKGNECIFDEGKKDWDDLMSTQEAENLASKDPGHDWRIVLHGPFHGEEYQRQDGLWVLISKNEGFA